MRLVNWELMSNPLNWITVALMILMALFILDLLDRFQTQMKGLPHADE